MIGHWPTMHPLQLKSLWIYPQNATPVDLSANRRAATPLPGDFFSGAGGGRVIAAGLASWLSNGATKMRTEINVGTRFKHPWTRNDTDKKPTICIVTQIRDGVVYFREYRPDRTLSSWTGELSEAAVETHFVLRNALRTEEQ